MIYKFIIYKTDGKIILALPEMPDNTDFENTRGDIWYNNTKLIGGINWNNVDWDFTDTGIEMDFAPDKYIYQNGNVTLNTEWTDEI